MQGAPRLIPADRRGRGPTPYLQEVAGQPRPPFRTGNQPITVCISIYNQELVHEAWQVEDGCAQREDGPAIRRFRDGELGSEGWRYHGRMRREHGPPLTDYFEGELDRENTTCAGSNCLKTSGRMP